MKNIVLVAGLGLIGGSIAKNLTLNNECFVIGFDQSEKTLAYAKEHQIVHETAHNFKEAAIRADYIILAAPISGTIELINELNNIPFEKQVIVTDVASVKGSVMKAAQSLTNEYVTFVGGHPMAGSHKTGITAAKEHLFENAMYILTPMSAEGTDAVNQVKRILQPLKSNFVILQPEDHDEMTSVVSHFPHLIASSLVHQARRWSDEHSFLPELAAGGFRDITRIASSNPKMWQDIFYHNGQKMSTLLEEWIMEMLSLKNILEKNSTETMVTYLQQAKEYRDGLDSKKRGAIPSYFDLYVDIKDKPGALARVTHLLAEKDISIMNIRILEMREGIDGALRLTFSRKRSQEEAHELLMHHGYETTKENR